MATHCPDWCAGGHHCTAQMPAGEHASPPEVWPNGIATVVATRYRSAQGGRGHLELRVVVELPNHEDKAVRLMRLLIARTYFLIARIVSARRRQDRSHVT